MILDKTSLKVFGWSSKKLKLVKERLVTTSDYRRADFVVGASNLNNFGYFWHPQYLLVFLWRKITQPHLVEEPRQFRWRGWCRMGRNPPPSSCRWSHYRPSRCPTSFAPWARCQLREYLMLMRLCSTLGCRSLGSLFCCIWGCPFYLDWLVCSLSKKNRRQLLFQLWDPRLKSRGRYKSTHNFSLRGLLRCRITSQTGQRWPRLSRVRSRWQPHALKRVSGHLRSTLLPTCCCRIRQIS